MARIACHRAPMATVALLVLALLVPPSAVAHGATRTQPSMPAVASRSAVVSFTDVAAGLTGVHMSSVAWADYDNDGDLDLLLTGYTGSVPVAKLYRNSGGLNPTFTDVGAGFTGVYQSSVAWGDYDGDGYVDVLITGFSVSGPITKLYHNNGGPNPTFTDVGEILTGVDVSSVAWGDYDNDGHLDLLVTGSDTNFNPVTKLYRNSGGSNPTFTDVGAAFDQVEQGSVAWGDYDKDGNLDVLITGFTGTTSIAKVYRNSGGSNPTFTDIGAGLTGVELSSVAWGDYDNDGYPDILLTGFTGSARIAKIYRNSGGLNPTFTDIGAALDGVNSSSVAFGDYDNDGFLDILLTGFTGTTRITKLYHSSGGPNPTFSDAGVGLTNVQNSSVAWGDYDNDGDLDILLTGYDTGNIPTSKIYRNTGAVANSPPGAPIGLGATTDPSGTTFAWSPVVDDHTPPIALTYNLRVGTTPGGNEISSAMASPSGFRRVVQLGNTQELRARKLKLPPGTYYWNVQQVDGAFAGSPFAPEQTLYIPGLVLVPTSIVGVSDGSVAWGDYDNDGDLDLLITGNNNGTRISKIYRNDGNGSFVDIGAALTGVDNSSVAWGDYDGDGDLDILLTGSTGSASISKVYRNDGNGVFTDIGAGLTGVAAGGVGGGSAAWGDYDNDGDLDILISGSDGTNNFTKVYRNDGNGVFTDIGAPLPGVIGSVAWGDYDNDGDLDIALAGFDGTNRIGKVYRNDGGTFVDTFAAIARMSSCSLAWGDYDNDGDLDLLMAGAVTNGGGILPTSSVFRNDRNDTFTGLSTNLTGVFHGAVAWGDFDNDGDLDILLSGDSGNGTGVSKVYRNDGNGVFTDIGAVLAAETHSSVAWGDYDNDGDLDILITGSGGTFLYRNVGRPSNAPPLAPTNLAAVRNGNQVTFSWSAPSDDHTPTSGLNYNLRVGTSPGGDQIVPGMAAASGYRRVPRLGNAQERTSWTIAIPPGSYYWSVQAIDGAFQGSPFASSTVAVDEERQPPTDFALEPPAPNPFAANVSLGFVLPRAATIELSVFDLMGRKVRVLEHGVVPAGAHRVQWDGRDEKGARSRDGIYLLRMDAEGQSWTRKLVLAH